MKCLCGYEYRRHWNFDTNKNDCIGEEEFIHIKGSFHVAEGYSHERVVCLFACPKCGTVQCR